MANSLRGSDKKLEWCTLGVSLIAIALSQFPPIREWNAKPDVSVKVIEKLDVHHMLGNPYFTVQTTIRNAGAARIGIAQAALTVTYPSGLKVKMPCKYVGGENYSSSWFGLNAEPGLWQTFFLTFYATPDAIVGQDGYMLAAEASNHLSEADAKRSSNDTSLPEMQDGLVRRSREFTEKSWVIQKGKYSFEVELLTIEGNVIAEKQFSAVLFDHQISQLRGSLDDMKWGYGVIYICQTGRHALADIE